MAFPTNPVDGQLYNENGKTWLYTSPPGVWSIAGGTPITVDEQDPVFTSSPAATYTEAPSDGTPYSRQDGGWVSAGGGLEVNDLTSSVTWADIPDANVPVTAVTQHQAALTITESQISDLTHTTPYTDSDVDAHLNTSTAVTGEYLSWNGSDYDWATVPAGYGDADVDTHLNTSSATASQVLSWTGADYDWVDAGGGGVSGISIATVGVEPTSTGTDDIAIGDGADATGGFGISIGSGSSVTKNAATAIGAFTSAQGIQSVSVGYNTECDGANSLRIGDRGSCNGASAISMGYQSSNSGPQSVSIGYQCSVSTSANRALALGHQAAIPASAAGAINITTASANTGISAANELVIETDDAKITYDATNGFVFTEDVSGTPVTYDLSSLGGGGGGVSGIDIAPLVNEPTASGNLAVAIGQGALATSNQCIALGVNANAAGASSIAIGQNTSAPNVSSGKGVVIGDASSTTGGFATIVGADVTTVGNFSTVVGYGATTGAQRGTALGFSADATGDSSISIGAQSSADGTAAISIGDSSLSSTDGVAIGRSSKANATGAVAIGLQAGTGVSTRGVAIGYGAAFNGTPQTGIIHINGSAAGNITTPAETGEILIKTDSASASWKSSTGWELTEGASTARIDPAAGVYNFPNLPTADPVVAGQLWNDAGTLKVSAG